MYSSNFHGSSIVGPESGSYWMGLDWAKYQTRLAGNLKRAGEFKLDKISGSEYITMSYKDTKNLCFKKNILNDKAVG
jgi:hypothetical protein